MAWKFLSLLTNINLIRFLKTFKREAVYSSQVWIIMWNEQRLDKTNSTLTFLYLQIILGFDPVFYPFHHNK